MKRLDIATLGLALIALPGWAQDFDAVQIQTVQASDNVYMLVGAGGNIGVSIGDDGVIVIDDQFAPLSDKIMAAIEDLSNDDVRFLINTHYHGDHVGGNEAFAETGTVIVAHDNVRARMSAAQFSTIFNQETPASPAAALPIVTFSDEMSFHWNGDSIRVIHVQPAHTDGDSILVFEEANVVHMGDTLFLGCYPYIDVDAGGDINGIIAAGYRVLSIADDETTIIPGHGPLTDAEGLADWLDMVKGTRASMQSAIAQGMSEDQALAAGVTSDYDARLADGCFMNPETYNRLLYRSLSR